MKTKQGLSQVHLAIKDAQVSLARVGHDRSTEEFDYTSAEHMLTVVRPILLLHGLCVTRRAASVTVSQARSDSGCLAVLSSIYSVRHIESGEVYEFSQDWLYESSYAWASDRAHAAALTMSLAYALRDLLLLPRGKPHDERADDRPAMDDAVAARGRGRGRKEPVARHDYEPDPARAPGLVREGAASVVSLKLRPWPKADHTLAPAYWQLKLMYAARGWLVEQHPEAPKGHAELMVAEIERQHALPGPTDADASDAVQKYADAYKRLHEQDPDTVFAPLYDAIVKNRAT